MFEEYIRVRVKATGETGLIVDRTEPTAGTPYHTYGIEPDIKKKGEPIFFTVLEDEIEPIDDSHCQTRT